MSELTSFKRRAYLLIEVEIGKEAALIRSLQRMDKVSSVDLIHGEYDLIAILEGSYKEIDETVLAVRKLPGVRKTVTLTAFEPHLKALEEEG